MTCAPTDNPTSESTANKCTNDSGKPLPGEVEPATAVSTGIVVAGPGAWMTCAEQSKSTRRYVSCPPPAEVRAEI